MLATSIDRGLLRRSRRSCSSPSTADDLLQLTQPAGSGLIVGAHAGRLGRRADAQHRDVDVRHAARAGGPARPRQRHGRHRHRRVVRDHVGVQRPGHRQPRHGLGVLRLASRSPSAPCCTCARSTSTNPSPRPPRRDRRRTSTCAARFESIRAVPGLMLLILLAAFNNLLGGVFMALLDAYGLSIVSVETWGSCSGAISTGVHRRRSRRGQGRARFAAGCAWSWSATSSTGSSARCSPLRSSIVLLSVGMFVWLLLIPVIEAAEQTVLQRSIPFERQGRVFGFAQLVENAAAPLTAMFMAPIAERVFMPFMTDGRGADLDRRLVRHRPRAWPGAHVHARRPDRGRRHVGRADVPVVPPPGRRDGGERRMTPG